LHLFTDRFESPIHVITNKKNLGLPASINRGIRAASAPYIVRVDSDDFVNSNFLNFLSFYLDVNPEADAVACDYVLLDDEERVLKRCNCDESPIACGIMFRKHQLFEVGLYDENFLCNEERDLRIRFEKSYTIHRLQIPLYRYRRHETNLTNNKNQMLHHDQMLLDKHKINALSNNNLT
jgi:glycosyltransferase involved in cell wall biosynthesis